MLDFPEYQVHNHLYASKMVKDISLRIKIPK